MAVLRRAVLNTARKSSLTSSNITGNTMNLQTVMMPQSPGTPECCLCNLNKEEEGGSLCFTFAFFLISRFSSSLAGDPTQPVIQKLLITLLQKIWTF